MDMLVVGIRWLAEFREPYVGAVHTAAEEPEEAAGACPGNQRAIPASLFVAAFRAAVEESVCARMTASTKVAEFGDLALILALEESGSRTETDGPVAVSDCKAVAQWAAGLMSKQE